METPNSKLQTPSLTRCNCTGCRLVGILLGLVDNSRMSRPERNACFDALYLLDTELKHVEAGRSQSAATGVEVAP